MYKLAILNTHPIQYFAPLYRRLAHEPDIDLTVYFCSRQGAEEYFDPGFGTKFKWDRPLVDGYHHCFLTNARRRNEVAGFWSLINWEIIKELWRNRYDALLVNGHSYATYLIAIFAAKLMMIPVFMRCDTHLSLPRSPIRRLIRKPLMRFFYNRVVTACLSIGTANREFYSYHGVSKSRLFSVPFVVDNKDFTMPSATSDERAGLRAEIGLPGEKVVALFVSKLLPGKRPMDLLLAFERLGAGSSEAALAFVGSGEQEQALRDHIASQQIQNIYFFGFRNQSELRKFYSAADLFVFPSERESWGLVLNEAMCAGLPVIVSHAVGSGADLVQAGQNGFLFEAGNVDELTNCLRELLKSPDLRMRMGTRSREIIKDWDLESCVRGIREALTYVKPQKAQLTEREAA